MYNTVQVLPLDRETLRQDIRFDDGPLTTLSLPAHDYDLVQTYRRVGIFDFLDTETGKICSRPDIMSAQSGILRRATQYEYDKWAHECVKERFSGNAFVFGNYLSK